MAKTVLVTGANGRMGHALIPALKEKGHKIVSIDKVELTDDLAKLVDVKVTHTILDQKVLHEIIEKNNIETIFHLATTLAVTSELDPEEAHDTNATGTIEVFTAALKQTAKVGTAVRVIFPSSIAVYGLSDGKTRNEIVVTEDEYINPQTIYGITKLYCEQLGIYYSDRYRMLDQNKILSIDFRALRLPGIVSEFQSQEDMGKYAGLTMVHSPAEGQGFETYLKDDTVLPFISMESAVQGLIMLSEAPKEKLTRRVYNISGFTHTVKELTDGINKQFPDSSVSENLDQKRQMIVDSWPAAIDDSRAREDWGWK